MRTRMTGNMQVNEAAWDPKKGIFTWANLKPYAADETYVVENGGMSVSIYTVDYAAPLSEYASSIMQRLAPLTKAD